MPSLSPEAIEILKSIHGQMRLKFKGENTALAFYRKFQNPPFFQEELGKFQLGDCFDWPKYMWPDEENNEEEYWYINITEYGRGASNLLKTLGMI